MLDDAGKARIVEFMGWSITGSGWVVGPGLHDDMDAPWTDANSSTLVLEKLARERDVLAGSEHNGSEWISQILSSSRVYEDHDPSRPMAEMLAVSAYLEANP